MRFRQVSIKKVGFFAVLMTVMAVHFWGCAARKPFPEKTGAGVGKQIADEAQSWWYARFRWYWPSGHDDPNWHLDLLLAHRVVAPILERFEPDLTLWRFHRRAIRDRAGHQFSFIFYSTRKTAERLYEIIEQDSVVESLKHSGLLEKTVFDPLDAENPPRPEIEDTSDKNWPLTVQKSWPYYIEGVSRMWLKLIEQTVLASEKDPVVYLPIEELETIYLEVEKSMQKIWRRKGYHAFLHHLNAIFGYAPLIIYEKRLMEF